MAHRSWEVKVWAVVWSGVGEWCFNGGCGVRGCGSVGHGSIVVVCVLHPRACALKKKLFHLFFVLVCVLHLLIARSTSLFSVLLRYVTIFPICCCCA
jgi:hypothetical protein